MKKVGNSLQGAIYVKCSSTKDSYSGKGDNMQTH